MALPTRIVLITSLAALALPAQTVNSSAPNVSERLAPSAETAIVTSVGFVGARLPAPPLSPGKRNDTLRRLESDSFLRGDPDAILSNGSAEKSMEVEKTISATIERAACDSRMANARQLPELRVPDSVI